MTAISAPPPQSQWPNSICLWIHENPRTTKGLNVSGLLLGLGLLCSIPFSTPRIANIVGLSLTGGLLSLASSVGLFALDLFVPPHHDMKTHVYKPAECDAGKLDYEGDVPVLILNSDDHYKAGKAHGYLCGNGINRIYKQFMLLTHSLFTDAPATKIPYTLATLRKSIPTKYLDEIKGLVEGYKQWSKEHWWLFPIQLTEEDVLLMQLIPDSMHMSPVETESAFAFMSVYAAIAEETNAAKPSNEDLKLAFKSFRELINNEIKSGKPSNGDLNSQRLRDAYDTAKAVCEPYRSLLVDLRFGNPRDKLSAIISRLISRVVGCSTVTQYDSHKKVTTLVRNLDWSSYGVAGTYSLVINRKYISNLHNTVDVGFPGFIGILTGINDSRLSFSNNTCSGHVSDITGMPIALYNRDCLEQCATVKEMVSLIDKRSPLGPYHLITSDPIETKSIHFYQLEPPIKEDHVFKCTYWWEDENYPHLIRSAQENQPFATFNCRYKNEDDGDSDDRQKVLDGYFCAMPRKDLTIESQNKIDNQPLENVLSLPEINNWGTIHSIVIVPETWRFEVGFDNAFSGKVPLQRVPIQKLLLKNLHID